MSIKEALSTLGITPVEDPNTAMLVGQLTEDDLDGWYRVALQFPANMWSPPSKLLAAKTPEAVYDGWSLYFHTPGLGYWSLHCMGAVQRLLPTDEPEPAASVQHVGTAGLDAMETIASLDVSDVERSVAPDDEAGLDQRSPFGTAVHESLERMQRDAAWPAAGRDE